MLKANKKKWFEKIFKLYNRNLFQRRFSSLRVFGLKQLKMKTRDFSLIVYANHSSWWDGLVLYEIFSRSDFDNFVMMEEKQLVHLPLFRWLGAFSIVRSDPREVLRSINYAVGLLKENTATCLWIFPQGTIAPNDSRPLGFQTGITRILEKTGKCFVLPVALRYEFLNDFKPEVFARIGDLELIEINTKNRSENLTQKLENKLTNVLDELKCQVINQHFKDFENLL